MSTNQKFLDVFVIGENAIVHHHEFVLLVGPLWMRVVLRGSAVSGPASVSNSDVHIVLVVEVKVLTGPNSVFQGFHFTLSTNDLNGAIVLVEGDTCHNRASIHAFPPDVLELNILQTLSHLQNHILDIPSVEDL